MLPLFSTLYIHIEMVRNKTKSAKAAGKLILEIDREFAQAAEDASININEIETKLGLAHDLLQAGNANSMKSILGKRTLKQYFGSLWVESTPKVKEALNVLEDTISEEYV